MLNMRYRLVPGDQPKNQSVPVPWKKEFLIPMDTRLVQDGINKNSEFVERAADIITKLAVEMDKCCPDCRELIKGILKT
jgi:hypothetical protein